MGVPRFPGSPGSSAACAPSCWHGARWSPPPSLELGAERIKDIRLGATIHDIGKIGIPAEVLSKPSRLTEIELRIVREHARIVAGRGTLYDAQAVDACVQVLDGGFAFT